MAEAGTALAPTQLRSFLLWYDGTTESKGADLAPFDAVQDLLSWQAEAIRCLESAAFRARLAKLEPQAAARVLSAVSELRAEIEAARRFVRIGHVAQTEAKVHPLRAVTPREARVLEERFGVRSTKPSLVARIEERFFSVLRLARLEPEQVIDSESGLRELVIETSPRVRVLLGLDFEGRRLIALLGETLDRTYYGDSVRYAEQRFARYLTTAQKSAASR